MSLACFLSINVLVLFHLLQMIQTQGSTRNAVNYQHIINRSVFYNDSVLLSLESLFPRLDKELKYDPSVPPSDQVFIPKTRFVKLNQTWETDQIKNCYGILKKNDTTFFTCCFEAIPSGSFLLQIAEVTFYVSSQQRFQKINLRKQIQPGQKIVDIAWNTISESLYVLLQQNTTESEYSEIDVMNMSLLVVDLKGGLRKVMQENFTICASKNDQFLPNFDLVVKYLPETSGSNIQTSLILILDYGIENSFRVLMFSHRFDDYGTAQVSILHEAYSPHHYPGEKAVQFSNCSGRQLIPTTTVDIPHNCSVKSVVATTWTLQVVCVQTLSAQTATTVMSFIPCLIADQRTPHCMPNSRTNMSAFTDKFRSEDRDYTPTQIMGYFLPIDPRDSKNKSLDEKESEVYMITQEALFLVSVRVNSSGQVEYSKRQERNFTLEKRYSFAKPILLHRDTKGNLVAIVESKSGFKFPMVTNFEKNTTRVYKEKILSEIVDFFYDATEHTPFLVGTSIPSSEKDILKFPAPVFYRDYEQEVLIAFFDEGMQDPRDQPRYIRGKLATDDLQTVLEYQFIVYPSFDYVSGNSLQSFESCKIYGYQLQRALETGKPIDLPYEHTELSGNGYKYSGQTFINRDNSTMVTVRDETIKRINPQLVTFYLNLTRTVLMFEKYILCMMEDFFMLVEPSPSGESLSMSILNTNSSSAARLLPNDILLDFVAFRLYPESQTDDTVVMVLIWRSSETVVDQTTGSNITKIVTKGGVFTLSKRKVQTVHSVTWNAQVIKVDIVAFGMKIDVIGIIENHPDSDGGRFIFQFSGPLYNKTRSPFPPTLTIHKTLNLVNTEIVDFYRDSYLGSLNVRRLLLDDPDNLPTIEAFTFYRQVITHDEAITFELLHEVRTSVLKYEVVSIAEEIVILKDLRRHLLIVKTVEIDSKVGPWILTYVLPTPDYDKLLDSRIYGKILYLTFAPDLLIIYDISSQGSINMLKRVIGEYKVGFQLVEYLPDGSTDNTVSLDYATFAAISVNKVDSSATSIGLYIGILKRKRIEQTPGVRRSFIVESDFLLMDAHRPKISLAVTTVSKNGQIVQSPSNSPLKCSAYLELKMQPPSFLSLNKTHPEENILSQYIKITMFDFNSRLIAKIQQQYHKKPDVPELMKQSSEPVSFDLTELIGTTSHVLRYRLVQPADSGIFSVTQTLKMLPTEHPVYATLPILPLGESDSINVCDNFTIVVRPDRIDITERNILISESSTNLTTSIRFENPYQYTIIKYPSESVLYWAVMACHRLNFAQTRVEILLISRTNPTVFARTTITAEMTIQQSASLGVMVGSNTSQILLLVCQNTTSSLMTTLHFATIKLFIKNHTIGLKSGIKDTQVDTKALTYDLEYELANTKFFYLEGELIMVSIIKYSAHVMGLFIEVGENFVISIKEPILTRLESMSNTPSSNITVLVDEKNLEIKILSMHEADQTVLAIHSVRFSLDLEDDKRFYSKLEHTLPWPKAYSHLQKFRHSNELMLVRTADPDGYMFYFVYSLQDKRIVGSLTYEDFPNCTQVDFNQAKLFMLRAQRAVYVMIPGKKQHFVFQFDFPKLWVHKQETFNYNQIKEYKLVMEGLHKNNQAEFPLSSMITLDIVEGWGRWTPYIWAAIVILVIGMAVFLVYYRIQANKRMKKERKPKKNSSPPKSPSKPVKPQIKQSLMQPEWEEQPSSSMPNSFKKSLDASTLSTTSDHL